MIQATSSGQLHNTATPLGSPLVSLLVPPLVSLPLVCLLVEPLGLLPQSRIITTSVTNTQQDEGVNREEGHFDHLYSIKKSIGSSQIKEHTKPMVGWRGPWGGRVRGGVNSYKRLSKVEMKAKFGTQKATRAEMKLHLAKKRNV